MLQESSAYRPRNLQFPPTSRRCAPCSGIPMNVSSCPATGTPSTNCVSGSTPALQRYVGGTPRPVDPSRAADGPTQLLSTAPVSAGRGNVRPPGPRLAHVYFAGRLLRCDRWGRRNATVLAAIRRAARAQGRRQQAHGGNFWRSHGRWRGRRLRWPPQHPLVSELQQPRACKEGVPLDLRIDRQAPCPEVQWPQAAVCAK
jgi:hypothetical protein